ncbi:MAG TPA: HIT domain-containing protein, partial [Candidatus Binatia bacterium]
MKPLWAPWRMAYIEEGKSPGCIFCDRLDDQDDRARLVLARTPHTVVMLNKYPYNNAHVLLAPKRHENRLSSLRGEEYQDLSEAVRRSVDILQRVYRPGGFNLGMNLGRSAGAGVEDHLHWHVVPRWDGDTNFMPVVGETRVIPQHLFDSYDRLSPLFKDAMAS